MHLTPNRGQRFRFTQLSLFLLAVVLTGAGILGLATQAKAAPVSVTFDNGRLSLGLNKNLNVLPAGSTFPSPDLPTPQRTDIELSGDLTDGKLNFPAAQNTGLQFPYMHFMHPIEKELKVPLTLRVTPPGLTGTYDAATGNATIEGKMDLYIITGTGTTFPLPDGLSDLGVPPLNLFARCHAPGIPVSFSTENKTPITGQPFTGGFGVNGALTTEMEVPEMISENGGDCSLASPVSRGPGAIWLSNGVVDPVPQAPGCREDRTLCPTVPYFEIGTLRLSPKKKTVKAGKSMKLKLRVPNSGNIEATDTVVALKSSNKRVKVTPKTVSVDVPPGSSVTKTVRVKAKRAARGKSKITAEVGSTKTSATVKIKKAKKPKPRKRN